MYVQVYETSDILGSHAALQVANHLTEAVRQNGKGRLLLSTGASQLPVLSHLVGQDVPWELIEVFHLDEYIGIDRNHPASFRKYIKERFENLVHPKAVHYVEADGNLTEVLQTLTMEIRSEPVDVALIGIGENAHIAFNDPPADFTTQDAYLVVDLDERCKLQQVGEGWFEDVQEVPQQAITMSPYQILQSKVIVSSVPYSVKAEAVKKTLECDETNTVPATILKRHPNVTLYLDRESASLVDQSLLKSYLRQTHA